MNLDRLAERAQQPFWRPSWNLALPATFSPWKWFQWIPWPQNLDKDTKFITPRQMQMQLYWV